MYLAFDPGETTGWASFSNDGNIADKGQLNFNDLCSFLDNYCFPIEAVICEDFRIKRQKAKAFIGNRMETIQAIGAIRAFASRQKVPYILQDSGIKSIAEKWTGVSTKGLPHSQTHWIDAFNHGAYYLVRQGIRKTRLEDNGKV